MTKTTKGTTTAKGCAKTPVRRRKPTKPKTDDTATTPPVETAPTAPPVTTAPTTPTVDTAPAPAKAGSSKHLCAAFHNDNTVQIMFYPDEKIVGSLGYALWRREVLKDGTLGPKQYLSSHVGFKAEDTANWVPKSTAELPIQKYSWFDMAAAWDKTYVYGGAPMTGQPGALKEMSEYEFVTNKVSLTIDCGPYFEAAFTRGILASQHIAGLIPKHPDGSWDEEEFVKQLKTPGSAIRKAQGGRVVDLLLSMARAAAKEGGHVYDARYEFSDEELVAEYEKLAKYISLILGNTGKDDEVNKEPRARLKKAGVDVTDRMLPEGISHDKLGIRANAKGECVEVTGGSANGTFTALGTQTNNLTKIKWPAFAQRIKNEYWDPLKQDALKGGLASAHFRAQNAAGPIEEKMPDGTRIIAWRSPNMPDFKKPKDNPTMPPDMTFLQNIMEQTDDILMFLLFWPGWPSIMNKIMSLNQRKHNLFIRGAVSDPKAMPGANINLFHRPGESPRIVAASALETPFGAFKLKELLKLSTAHAIIHDKCALGDPHNPAKCWVAFGSHQLGFTASYANDEIMFIIIGPSAQPLVLAYMVHVASVYQTFKFRFLQNKGNNPGFTGFLKPDDTWQDRQFNLEGLKFEGDVWRKSGLLKPTW